jgi:hypothetical protein
MTSRRKTIAVWLAIYVVLTIGLGFGLHRLWSNQLQTGSRPGAQAEWEAWKADVERKAEDPSQPVARRVPKTTEPPAVILLRDHFPAVVVTGALVWTAFFGFMALVTTGVLRGTPPPSRD